MKVVVNLNGGCFYKSIDFHFVMEHDKTDLLFHKSPEKILFPLVIVKKTDILRSVGVECILPWRVTNKTSK